MKTHLPTPIVEPDKDILPGPHLLHGNFPDTFPDKIANTDSAMDADKRKGKTNRKHY